MAIKEGPAPIPDTSVETPTDLDEFSNDLVHHQRFPLGKLKSNAITEPIVPDVFLKEQREYPDCANY